jgi:hypothetical protein
MKVWTLSLVLVLSAPAAADVIKWRDAQGVRHYTNIKEEIPEGARAQVVIDESVRHRSPEAEPAVPKASNDVDPPRQAQVVYDRPAMREAYLDGVQQGMEMARSVGGPAAPSIQINGPLAIANAAPPQPSYVVGPYGYPLLTTSFDGGRSRHQTLRMLLQDEFAIERDLTFGYPSDYFLPIVPPVVPSPFLARRFSNAGPFRH